MDQINPLLTTILVTFNHKELGRTLQSLMKVRVQPRNYHNRWRIDRR